MCEVDRSGLNSNNHHHKHNAPPTPNWLDQLSLANALSDSPNFCRALSEAELTFAWLRAHFTLLLDAFNEAAESGQTFLKALDKLSTCFNISTLPHQTSDLFAKIPHINLPANQFYSVTQLLTSLPNNLDRLTNQIRSLISQMIIQVRNGPLNSYQQQVKQICQLRCDFVTKHGHYYHQQQSRPSSHSSPTDVSHLNSTQLLFRDSTNQYLSALRSGLTELAVDTYFKAALNCFEAQTAIAPNTQPQTSTPSFDSSVMEKLSKNCDLWVKAQKKSNKHLGTITPPSSALNNDNSGLLEGYLFKRSGRSGWKSWSRRWYRLNNNQLLTAKNCQGLLSSSSLDAAYRLCADRLVERSTKMEPNFPSILSAALTRRFVKTIHWEIIEPDLRLCTARDSSESESIDRHSRLAFELIGPRRQARIFQAATSELHDQWVNRLKTGLSSFSPGDMSPNQSHLSSRSSQCSISVASYSSESTTGTGSSDVDHLDKVKRGAGMRIWNDPDNRQCVDCGQLDADWASVNLGVTLCINCASAHRNLGVQVSKVRSLTLDDWEPQQLHVMLNMGNRVVNQIYEARLEAFPTYSHNRPYSSSSQPSTHSSKSPDVDHRRFDWASAKWAKRQFVWSPSAQGSTVDHRPNNDSVSRLVSWVNQLYNTWVEIRRHIRSSTIDTSSNNNSQTTDPGQHQTATNRAPHRAKQLLVRDLTNLTPNQVSDPRQWAPSLITSGARIGCPPLILAGLACGAHVDGFSSSTVAKQHAPPLHRSSSQPPLICAVQSGSLGACELLLLNGADINIRDLDGQTPLHHACLLERVYLVCLLLKRHADTQLTNNQGQTPLDLAIKQTNPDIVTLLRLHQLNMDSETLDMVSSDDTVTDVFGDYTLRSYDLDAWDNVDDQNEDKTLTGQQTVRSDRL